jgi:hypothetical protein
VTLPNNFVTVFHAATTDLGIELPWPKPDDYVPVNDDSPILIWGGASSVGQFAIQILRYYGYTNILATASHKRHEKLQKLGAKALFDYNDPNVVESLKQAGGERGISLIFDCIGSKSGSIDPISQVAKSRSKVAILLPVILRDSSETEAPEYEMDVSKVAHWNAGVDARGVRTHFYLSVSAASVRLWWCMKADADYSQNDFLKQHLQPDIMPTLLKEGVVTPQQQKIVEGTTMLERAQKAMDMLRRKEARMERLVWRINDNSA